MRVCMQQELRATEINEWMNKCAQRRIARDLFKDQRSHRCVAISPVERFFHATWMNRCLSLNLGLSLSWEDLWGRGYWPQCPGDWSSSKQRELTTDKRFLRTVAGHKLLIKLLMRKSLSTYFGSQKEIERHVIRKHCKRKQLHRREQPLTHSNVSWQWHWGWQTRQIKLPNYLKLQSHINTCLKYKKRSNSKQENPIPHYFLIANINNSYNNNNNTDNF